MLDLSLLLLMLQNGASTVVVFLTAVTTAETLRLIMVRLMTFPVSWVDL